MNKKNGLSLIMLVITIVILAILVASTITGTVLAVNNAKKVAFAEDLLEIQNAMEAKIAAGENYIFYLPSKMNEISWRISNQIYAQLEVELLENGENLTDTTKQISKFVQIDLESLGVTSTKYGEQSQNESGDIFLFSELTEKVYYMQGIEIQGKRYFSLTKNFIESTEVEEEKNDKPNYSYSSGHWEALVSKNTNEPTNRLIITLNEELEDCQEYYIEVGNITKKIEFTNNKFILEAGDMFSRSDLDGLEEIAIQKYRYGFHIAKTEIDISNLDVVPPSLEKSGIVESAPGKAPTIKVTATDEKSGIDSYYIDSFLKYKDGKVYKTVETTVPNYYSTALGGGSDKNILDYMQRYVKPSTSNILKIDSTTYLYRVAVKDKAGNMSNYITNEYQQLIPEGFYYVGGTIDTGIVISDNISDQYKGDSYIVSRTLKGNQFVYIPVNSEFDLKSEVTNTIINDSAASLSGKISEEEKNDILNAGGFYIARYEMSAETYAGQFSISNKAPLANISYELAKEKCENLYENNKNIKCVLPSLEAMNAVYNYIGESSPIGNYGQNRAVQKTGLVSQWSNKNIYDLLGNLEEWTTQSANKSNDASNSYKITRGLSNLDSTVLYPLQKLKVRKSGATSSYAEVGCRPMFYKKKTEYQNLPPIPQGFYYVGGTLESGVVISDDSDDYNKGTSRDAALGLEGNQFVWIPVEKGTIRNLYIFNNVNKYGEKLSTINNTLGSREPYHFTNGDNNTPILTEPGISTLEEHKNMVESVEKYGGFYIGRYETASDKSIKADRYVESGFTYLEAMEASRNYAKNKPGVTSALIYGSQWDAAVRKIVNKPMYDNITVDSSKYGNDRGTNGVYDTVSSSGYSAEQENFAVYNIYDMAGNYEEMTQEKAIMYNATYPDGYVSRGGSYFISGETISDRTVNNATYPYYDYAYRITMTID